MTYSDYKESDLHKCVIVTGELLTSTAKFAIKATTVLLKCFRWLAIKAYRYVMK
ncbi:hypothetical protein KI655_04070 [Vibrio sp. D404a]|uniref:hypothetical protein n=1 Tax=unclassified Vibrio TaxID=2614977 RepID=UPI0025527547|nr:MULTISPECIES: hypothetical protein [unclassified Vibrio]MDK9736467.1 hypothetical protein [Vibrio sp. D404a]MDK9796089.1 hypothetical protein [Vibrio sp. D449a]